MPNVNPDVNPDTKPNNDGIDEQGKPVKVNAAAAEPSRDLKKPHDYQQESARTKSPSAPVLDDEEVDHASENDFSYNTQKSGTEQANRQI